MAENKVEPDCRALEIDATTTVRVDPASGLWWYRTELVPVTILASQPGSRPGSWRCSTTTVAGDVAGDLSGFAALARTQDGSLARLGARLDAALASAGSISGRWRDRLARPFSRVLVPLPATPHRNGNMPAGDALSWFRTAVAHGLHVAGAWSSETLVIADRAEWSDELGPVLDDVGLEPFGDELVGAHCGMDDALDRIAEHVPVALSWFGDPLARPRGAGTLHWPGSSWLSSEPPHDV